MPVFELPDANGATVRSADLQGKVIVVRFWASW
jgi:peroxiredoxin